MTTTTKIITDIKKLHKKSMPLTKKEIQSFRNEWGSYFELLKESSGVGLAAPQIDIFKRFFIISYQEENIVCINPKITGRIPFAKEEMDEGCLSIPGEKYLVIRDKMIRVEFTDENGIKVTRDLNGHLARIFQHEYDHLEGILISDIGIKNTEQNIDF